MDENGLLPKVEVGIIMSKKTELVTTGFEVVRQTLYGSDAGLNSGKPGVDCNIMFRR